MTFPIAAILDKILGDEAGTFLSKSQMKKLFQHYEGQKLLKPSERRMLSAALELKEKKVGNIMTPLAKTFMIDINQNLNEDLKQTIYQKGHSRIPVFEGSRDNIVGILMCRDLILTNLDSNIFTIRQLQSILVREVIAIDENTLLGPILTFFKRGESHIAIVTRVEEVIGGDPILKKIGIVTLEDIIEELLQEEIEDEKELIERMGERTRMKEKLVLLFSDHKASKVLNTQELIAIEHYCQLQIEPFAADLLPKEQLRQLISCAQIIDIESDSLPFSHNIDDVNS